ncbi:hypothetical protein [Ancylobacter mangrovi]|uniref:hypothetical protein n=1 Tax=Ancylobacter mangrovi TaxID=2972472 RepID=UPI0021628878|nr:hypothetical protein [Ancylobacter mangrovi]MCS0501564.1 hypothetical protein [Ancylobacter mangrovi]
MSHNRLSMSGRPMPDDDVHACFICGEPFVDGQMVIVDVTEGLCHRACCGEDRESYVRDIDTCEPLGRDDPIPAGDPYRSEDFA